MVIIDEHMNVQASAAQIQPTSQPGGGHPLSGIQQISQDQIEQKAGEVLDVGERWGRVDNYEARLDFFAVEIATLDIDDQARLTEEVFRQDNGAGNSWLTPERLQARLDEGHISQREADAVVTGFAAYYNDNRAQADSEANFDLMLRAVDFVGLYNAANMPGIPGQNEAFGDLLEMVNTDPASQRGDAVMEAFRENLAEDVLQQWALNPNSTDTFFRDDLINTAFNVAAQNGPEAELDLMRGLTDENRATVLEALATKGQIFGGDDYAQVGAADPLVSYMDAVAQHGTTEEALELVRLVHNGDDYAFFDRTNEPADARAEGLARVFLAHQEGIINVLTENNPNMVPGSTNENATVLGQNLNTLSTVLRFTALNPENAHQQEVLDSLGEQIAELKAQANVPSGERLTAVQEARQDDAAARLAMLGATMQEAVASGYLDAKSDIAAREAFVGFMIDVALAGIPLASAGKGAIASQVTAFVGSNTGLSEGLLRSTIEDAIKGIPNELIGQSNSAVEAAIKEAIVDALPEDFKALESIKLDANAFITDTLSSGYNRDNDLSQAIFEYRDQIQQSR